MNILVCGPRDWQDERQVRQVLHRNYYDARIIVGDAPGVDTFAYDWARDFGRPVARYSANWKKYGKSAGPRRNQRMLDEERPDLVVAFTYGPDLTPGTRDMVEKAMKKGVKVVIYGPERP